VSYLPPAGVVTVACYRGCRHRLAGNTIPPRRYAAAIATSVRAEPRVEMGERVPARVELLTSSERAWRLLAAMYAAID